MENKNLKVIIGLGIVIIITIIALAIIFSGNKNSSKQSNQISSTKTSSIEEVKKSEIKNIVGKIVSIKSEKIEVTSLEGQNLVFQISPELGASFVKQTPQSNGSILVKNVGLFDLPQNQPVSIQYYSLGNYIRLIEF